MSDDGWKYGSGVFRKGTDELLTSPECMYAMPIFLNEIEANHYRDKFLTPAEREASEVRRTYYRLELLGVVCCEFVEPNGFHGSDWPKNACSQCGFHHSSHD